MIFSILFENVVRSEIGLYLENSVLSPLRASLQNISIYQEMFLLMEFY
jgi:hypothetical protein